MNSDIGKAPSTVCIALI